MLCSILLLSLFQFNFGSGQVQSTNLSPLEQIKNGTPPEKVLCSKDFIRFEKLSDKSVVCVKSSTAGVLSKRGWGTLLPQEISKDQAIAKMNEYDTQHHGCVNCFVSDPSEVHYVFLKHIGTKGLPNFIMYQSDQTSKYIGEKWGEISFIKSNETNAARSNLSEYMTNDTNDRYAWASSMTIPIWTTMTFVDPLTGEVIGHYSAGCSGCQ